MALNSLFCADVPLSNYSLTFLHIFNDESIDYNQRLILIPAFLLRTVTNDATSLRVQNI